MNRENEIILDVQNLKKYFPIRGGLITRTVGHVKAVDGISFKLRRGETLGIVGESGCGKSTAGRTILRLHDITDGKVIFKGEDLAKCSKKEMRAKRLQMQMVFQDPYASLNPRMTVGNIIGEALLDHKLMSKAEAREKVLETMEICGLPTYYINRYPHEFSGGQRQRIGIARSLILNRHRPRARHEPEVRRLRRGCFRAGRVYSVTDHQPARRSSGEKQLLLHFHFA